MELGGDVQLPVGVIKLTTVPGQDPIPTQVVVSDQMLERYGFQVSVSQDYMDQAMAAGGPIKAYTEIPPEEQFPIPRKQIGI